MSTNVQRLRKYELHERLGSNNLAEVWMAFDPELQSYVALKIFHANLQNDPAFMTRFWNLPFSQEPVHSDAASSELTCGPCLLYQ